MISAQTHYNSVLTGFAVEFTPPELVAEKVVRKVKVTHDTDVYPQWAKDFFDTVNDIRADGDSAKEVDLGWNYVPYQTEEHALRTKITAKMRRNADSQLNLERRKTAYVKQLVLNNLEARIFGTGGFLRTTANNLAATNVDWSNLSTASPYTNMRTAIDAIEAAAGVTPNTVVMTTNVARHIMATTEWLERNKYVTNLSQEGGAGDLPDQFYGLNATYVRSLVNTAKKGQAESLTRIMGTDVWIGYVAPDEEIGEQTLTHSVNLWTLEETRKWWDDERKTDWIEYAYEYVPHPVAVECGYLLTSVLN